MTMPLRERDKVMVGVDDVASSMGRVLTKSQAWKVGARIRDEYIAQVGSLPPKQMTAKKDGTKGSHMKAAYPISWVPRIQAIILEVNPDRSPQLDFFIDIMPLGLPF